MKPGSYLPPTYVDFAPTLDLWLERLRYYYFCADALPQGSENHMKNEIYVTISSFLSGV